MAANHDIRWKHCLAVYTYCAFRNYIKHSGEKEFVVARKIGKICMVLTTF